MSEAESRLAEVTGLLKLMEDRKVLCLTVGDITITREQTVPDSEFQTTRTLSVDEREAADRAARRKLTLSAGSRIIGRVGE